jgi:hypothetical protein
VRALVQELRRGGFLNILGSVFARHDRALHEALLIRQMFACKINAHVRFLQDRAYTKPLTWSVEGIGALGIFMCLPGLGVNLHSFGVRAGKNILKIVRDHVLQLLRVTSVHRVQVIGLVTYCQTYKKKLTTTISDQTATALNWLPSK